MQYSFYVFLIIIVVIVEIRVLWYDEKSLLRCLDFFRLESQIQLMSLHSFRDLYVKHPCWCNTQINNVVFTHKQLALSLIFIIWQQVSTSSKVMIRLYENMNAYNN